MIVTIIHAATDVAMIVLPIAVYCKVALIAGRFTGLNDSDPLEDAKAQFNAAVDRGDTRAINRTWKQLSAARHAQLADEIHWRGK